MSRQFLLGVLAIAIMVFIVWGSGHVLLFGGLSNRGAAGEWVGTLTITQGYPVPAAPAPFPTPLPHPRKAAIYFKLSSSDSFMREYSGPGELHVAGDPNSFPLRLGSFRINSPGNHAKGAFISENFLDTTVDGSFKPGAIHLENTADGSLNDYVSFTADLHPGSRAEYLRLLTSPQRDNLQPSPASHSATSNATLLRRVKHA